MGGGEASTAQEHQPAAEAATQEVDPEDIPEATLVA